MSVVVCDGPQKAQALLAQHSATPSLKCIVVMDPLTPELTTQAQAKGVEVVFMPDLLVSGTFDSQKASK